MSMFDDDDEDFFDEMMEFKMLHDWEQEEMDTRRTGSCLAFIVCIGAMIAIPIALFAHYIVL